MPFFVLVLFTFELNCTNSQMFFIFNLCHWNNEINYYKTINKTKGKLVHLINKYLTQRLENLLISVALKHNKRIKKVGKTVQFPVLTWDPIWTVSGLEIGRKSPGFPLLSFLWVIHTGYNYSLQLNLKPVLSFHYLLVFSNIVHELDFTDGPLAVRSVNYWSVKTTSKK